jgi:hypothetical protein
VTILKLFKKNLTILGASHSFLWNFVTKLQLSSSNLPKNTDILMNHWPILEKRYDPIQWIIPLFRTQNVLF